MNNSKEYDSFLDPTILPNLFTDISPETYADPNELDLPTLFQVNKDESDSDDKRESDYATPIEETHVHQQIVFALHNKDESDSDDKRESGYSTPIEETNVHQQIVFALHNSEDLILKALKESSLDFEKETILLNLGDKLKNNPDFFKRNKISLRYAGPEVFNDAELIQTTIFRSPDEYEFLPKNLQKDESIIDRMIFLIDENTVSLKIIYKLCEQILILHGEKLILENQGANNRRLEFLFTILSDDEHKTNFIRSYVHCYRMLPFNYKNNSTIALLAFHTDNSICEYLPIELLENKDFVLEALTMRNDVPISDLIRGLNAKDMLDLLDSRIITFEDIRDIKLDDNSIYLLEYPQLLIGLLKRYKNTAEFGDLLKQWKPFIQENQNTLYNLIKINPSYCELASEGLRNKSEFMSLAIYCNMDCLRFVGEQLKQDNIFQNIVYQMSESYMLELIAKTTLSLGLAALGIIVLTQMVTLPFLLIAATSVVTGLCASGFFAKQIFDYNRHQNQYQVQLDGFRI